MDDRFTGKLLLCCCQHQGDQIPEENTHCYVRKGQNIRSTQFLSFTGISHNFVSLDLNFYCD